MDRSLGDGGMALLGHLGVSFDAYGDGWATAAWIPTEIACNPAGTVHGGVYGVVHDADTNLASNAALESGDRTATLELKYSMLRSARAGDELSVRGEVVRLARQVAYLETAIRDADGEPVSKGTGTFLVRRKDNAS
jgi:uncharacterized protein (TIGR00369 family)